MSYLNSNNTCHASVAHFALHAHPGGFFFILVDKHAKIKIYKGNGGENMAVSLNERPILKGAAAEKFLCRHNELEKKAQERAEKVRRVMARRSGVKAGQVQSEGMVK